MTDIVGNYATLPEVAMPIVGTDGTDGTVVFARTGRGVPTLYQYKPETDCEMELTDLASSPAPWTVLPTSDGVFVATTDGDINRVTADDRQTIVTGPGSAEPWDYHPDDGLYVLRKHEGWTLERATDDGTTHLFDYPEPVPR